MITRKEIRISYQIGTTPRLHVKITRQSDDKSDDDRNVRYRHDTTYLPNFSDTQLEKTIISDQMLCINFWVREQTIIKLLKYSSAHAVEWMKMRLKLKLYMEWIEVSSRPVLFFSFFSFFSKFQFSSSRILFCILIWFLSLPFLFMILYFYILVPVSIFFSSLIYYHSYAISYWKRRLCKIKYLYNISYINV